MEGWRITVEANGRAKQVRKHTDLEVYGRAFNAAVRIFQLTKTFAPEERYSLIDQIRRSSRSVCANIAEGWRKRRYPAAFVNKLSDAEGEAAETQVWLQFSVKCGYLDRTHGQELYREYDAIIGQLVNMSRRSDEWSL